MKSKFKKGDTVRDDCGCQLKILAIKTPYYITINISPSVSSVEYNTKTGELKDASHLPEPEIKIRIKDLDSRAIKIERSE